MIPIETIILISPFIIALWMWSILFFRHANSSDLYDEGVDLLKQAVMRVEEKEKRAEINRALREKQVFYILKRKEELLDQNDRLKKEIRILQVKIADKEIL